MSDDNLMMYETQHFGFTPQSCLDGMYNAVQEYIYSMLKAGEDCVLEYVARRASHSSSLEKVRQGTQLLIDHMKSHLDMTFELIELYIAERVFTVPPGVLLPEDRPHAAPLANDADEERRLNAKLAELRSRHRQEMAIQALLQAELEEQRAALEALEVTERRLDDLKRVWRGSVGTDAPQAFRFALQHAQRLRERAGALHVQRSPAQEPAVSTEGAAAPPPPAE
ncbi:protein MIS12 homolog isoform X2 [Petromyzon marinus]